MSAQEPTEGQETVRERTWRERQEAKKARDSALVDLLAAQDAAEEAKQRYYDAERALERAVQANVEAWAVVFSKGENK